jgi:hypothetical protein
MVKTLVCFYFNYFWVCIFNCPWSIYHKNWLYSLNYLCSFVETQLTIIVKVYFWTFLPLIYVYLLPFHITIIPIGLQYALKSDSSCPFSWFAFYKNI